MNTPYRYLSEDAIKQLELTGSLTGLIRVPTRKSFEDCIVTLGRDNERIVVLTADSERTMGTVNFDKAYPERHFHFGIAEQNMMAAAAGMATTGLIPFIAGFAIFMTTRALDQLRNSIHYPKLNVKIAASHSGITTGSDGVTHQALEDLAIIRSIANSVILAPSDDTSAKKAIAAAVKYDGPVYISLTREAVPVLYKEDFPYEFGKAYVVREGTDVTIAATRDMVAQALMAAEILARQGIEAEVIDFQSVKPLDNEALIDSARKTGAVISVESGTINGGFGGAVAEVISENYPVMVKRIGIRDVFTESAEYVELLEKYGLSAHHIAEESIHIIKNKRN